MDAKVDAIVVGSGPNGLAAAITLARAGRSVRVLEAATTPGGGLRTAELTLPGHHHDVCAAVVPLAAASPFMAGLDLDRHGVELLHPEVPLAHPLDGGRAGVLWRSIDDTAAALGVDGARWRSVFGTPARTWERWIGSVLRPLPHRPEHPVDLLRFGRRAGPPAAVTIAGFHTDEARALVAGLAGHALLPLWHPLTASFAIVLGAAAHAVGWPIVAGGSQRLVDAMVAELMSLGGTVECGRAVTSMSGVADGGVVLFDLPPRRVVEIAGADLGRLDRWRYRRFRPGPGVFKLDLALSEPVPWAAEACRRAGTVHVAGTAAELAAAEHDMWRGRHPAAPFVLVGQQSVVDPLRAPAGRHTLWAYCHVPNGSTVSMVEPIERQIERFAPGFRDTIVARHVAGPRWYESYNGNDVGGDISGGSHGGLQLLARPGFRLHPYRTSDPRLFLCSASTPPGGGVHGMCGYNAALDVLDVLDGTGP
ncbi:MAG: phytoene desaturase family protein [Acidimicrobiales bacterium]